MVIKVFIKRYVLGLKRFHYNQYLTADNVGKSSIIYCIIMSLGNKLCEHGYC